MRDDPFAKLGALDQKLFTPPPPPSPAAAPAGETPTSPPPTPTGEKPLEPRKQASLEGRKVPTKQPWPTTHRATPAALDLNQRPDRQNTYAFTTEELEQLEDLKILIQRRYDLGVTKNDLIRCAVHLLLEDFESRGEGSAVLSRLRTKKAR